MIEKTFPLSERFQGDIDQFAEVLASVGLINEAETIKQELAKVMSMTRDKHVDNLKYFRALLALWQKRFELVKLHPDMTLLASVVSQQGSETTTG